MHYLLCLKVQATARATTYLKDLMKKIYKVMLLMLIITNKSCTCIGDPTIDIVDDYQVWSPDGKHWQFWCKLGCGSHPNILDVQKVLYNENTIIVANKNRQQENEWYLFHSKQSKIKCCHGNTIVGPIDSLALTKFVEDNHVRNLNNFIVAE